MKTIQSMLDFLLSNRWEKVLAEAFLSASPTDMYGTTFWHRTYAAFERSAQGLSFEYYCAIARCHVLSAAVAAEVGCVDTWTKFVLDELTNRACHDRGLDAYVMGSQIGLFQAGIWLQENKKQGFGPSFLSTMGQYSLALMHDRGLRFVNMSGNEHLHAQQELDRAVKGYLRPENKELADHLKPGVRAMLLTIKNGLPTTSNPLRSSSGPESWLLNSLVHGALNIEKRDHHELVNAALAVVPA